jgi:hypothetical protein
MSCSARFTWHLVMSLESMDLAVRESQKGTAMYYQFVSVTKYGNASKPDSRLNFVLCIRDEFSTILGPWPQHARSNMSSC